MRCLPEEKLKFVSGVGSQCELYACCPSRQDMSSRLVPFQSDITDKANNKSEPIEVTWANFFLVVVFACVGRLIVGHRPAERNFRRQMLDHALPSSRVSAPLPYGSRSV